MCTHDPKACPRCGKAFACKPGTITECQCFGIRFTAEQREYIGQRYHDCLCRDCLLTLQNEVELFREKFMPR